MGWWSSNWFNHPYTLFRQILKESLSPFANSPSRLGWRSVFFFGQPGLVYISPPLSSRFSFQFGCLFGPWGMLLFGTPNIISILWGCGYWWDPHHLRRKIAPQTFLRNGNGIFTSVHLPSKNQTFSGRYLEPKWPGNVLIKKMTKSGFWEWNLNPQNSRVPFMGCRFSCTIWGGS